MNTAITPRSLRSPPPVTLVALALALGGCAKKREPAPTEMTDLVEYLFANWEDPEALPEALDNIERWLAANIDSEDAEKGYALDPIAAATVADVDHPGKALSSLIGACGAARSPFPLKRHAGHIVLKDHVFENPNSYDAYVRTVEGDADAFVAGEGLVRTSNDITTTSLGITIPYPLDKDYRWVESEENTAILARSWSPTGGCNEGGGNCLEQSFSVDLFLEHSATETWRLTASWSEVTSSIPLSEDVMTAALAVGLQNVFRSTDEFLAGEQ